MLQDNKNLSRRIEEFERVLEKNQVLEQFDRSVFESMIEKVIVGGIDDEGKKDPYKITFIYKNGFRDSMGQTKSKYGLSKKSGGNVCSHDSVKGEELYSNCEVDARRMRYAFTANEQHRERTITLDVEMEDYHRIKNGTEVTADATE